MANEWMKSYYMSSTDATGTGWYKAVDEDTYATGGAIKDAISNKKDKIREELKKYLTEEIRNAAQKEAGQLVADIEKLKVEKKNLKTSLTLISSELITMRKEIREEKKAIMEMMEKYANQTLRFHDLDIR